MSDPIILQCTFCLTWYNWNKEDKPEGIGYCYCRKGQFLESIEENQLFRVLKERPNPKIHKGHVIVMDHKGWQQLRGPNFRENPEGWRPYPVKVPK